jgi:hypothetical protein
MYHDKIKIRGGARYVNARGKLWEADIELSDDGGAWTAQAGGATPSEAIGLAVHFACQKRFTADTAT